MVYIYIYIDMVYNIYDIYMIYIYMVYIYGIYILYVYGIYLYGIYLYGIYIYIIYGIYYIYGIYIYGIYIYIRYIYIYIHIYIYICRSVISAHMIDMRRSSPSHSALGIPSTGGAAAAVGGSKVSALRARRILEAGWVVPNESPGYR